LIASPLWEALQETQCVVILHRLATTGELPVQCDQGHRAHHLAIFWPGSPFPGTAALAAGPEVA
jgi:hypothetical protein